MLSDNYADKVNQIIQDGIQETPHVFLTIIFNLSTVIQIPAQDKRK